MSNRYNTSKSNTSKSNTSKSNTSIDTSTSICSYKSKTDRESEEKMYDKFMDFVQNHWKENEVYTTSDFTKRFGITRHLARYYLFDKLTREDKLLFRTMLFNKSSFMKRTEQNIEMMSDFLWMEGFHLDLK